MRAIGAISQLSEMMICNLYGTLIGSQTQEALRGVTNFVSFHWMSLFQYVGLTEVIQWKFKPWIVFRFIAGKGSTRPRFFIRSAYTTYAFTGPLEKPYVDPPLNM